MLLDSVLKAIIALLPVTVLVVVLFHLDSHRLLHTRFMIRMFITGGLVAVVSYLCNLFAVDALSFNFEYYSRYVAPLIEETLKASVLVWLFRSHRIGFLIDAGILGFTVGAGFSFVENIYYLHMASDAHYGVWVMRGFGTAIMHGGATALFAIVAETLTERHLKMNWLLYLPGLVVAVLIHSIFNHFPVSPVLSTVVTLLILPTILFLLFERNEVSIHKFLETDFASHRRLLRQLEHGEFTGCEAGRFLMDMQKKLAGPVAEEMVHYFRVHTELVLSAEGLLLAREQGIEIEIGTETREKLVIMHRLEEHIGKSGLRTLRPHLQFSAKEMWEIHLLEDEAAVAHGTSA